MLPYPKSTFNVEELTPLDHEGTDYLPLAPLSPSLAEVLIDMAGEPELTLGFVDSSGDKPRLADELHAAMFMPPNRTQCCVVWVCKRDPNHPDGHRSDFYQMPYSEVAYRLHEKLRRYEENINEYRLFIASCNNAQFREWLEENGTMTISERIVGKLTEEQQEEIPESNEPPFELEENTNLRTN